MTRDSEDTETRRTRLEEEALRSRLESILGGHGNLKDTIVDVRSPLAKPRTTTPSSTPTTTPPPTAPAAAESKLAAALAMMKKRLDEAEVALVNTRRALETCENELDRTRKMVSAREGILQVVAHDLRNPLNLVKVGGNLIERMTRKGADGTVPTPSAEKLTPIADTMRVAVRRMERLITDLLDLEALDKGSLRLMRGAADASQIVDLVALELGHVAAERGVRLEVDRPPHPVLVACDKDRIAQVLENLVSNAIRFTPKDKRVVLRLTEPEGELRFEVADEGPGITDPDLRRIFDPYFRAEIPQGRGLGLGLSIALGLVRAHDGAIWAESAAGHGATFVFTMPRRDIARDTMVELPAVKLPMPERKKP
ncbi:MAG: HAMP domain-containing histidine kinase [Deltaproteobacteria bacterium]|nr:HAMP domain-containing histidine kinase [Deltaproteobacteria bacterium]